MPTREDLLLGQAAVARGLIPESELWSLLRELADEPGPPMLGDRLVARGVLTPAQRTDLEGLTRRMALAWSDLTRPDGRTDVSGDSVPSRPGPEPEGPVRGSAEAERPAETILEGPGVGMEGGAGEGTPADETATRAGRTPPPEPPGAVPPTFGKYRVLGELGRGGMGVVYRALDPDIHRVVALKVLPPGAGSVDDRVQRFQREVRTAASLRHPGIVAIYDVGVFRDTHYFTMDCIEGRSLADLLTERALSVREALETIRAMAEALDHAHRCGIVHRDIKPSNILIDRLGKTFLTDFGLAKEIESGAKLTFSGQVMGTPQYMSPEQANGDQASIDGRSDVYSLGAVLYECLTRKPPFTGSSPAAILYRVLQEDPAPVRAENPRVHVDVETICLKSLAKEKERRYATAGDLAADITRFLEGEPIQARPTSVLYRGAKFVRRNRLAVGVVVLAALGTAALWQWTKARAEQLERRMAEELAKSQEERRRAAEERAHRERRGRAETSLRKAALLRGADRLAALGEAVAADPEFLEAVRARGLALLARGEPARAHADFVRALELAPGDPASELGIARVEEEVRFDREAAGERCARVAARLPGAPAGMLAEGIRARLAGDPAAAIAALTGIGADGWAGPWAAAERAAASLARGDLQAALAAAGAALDLDPEDGRPLRLLGEAHLGDRDPVAAIARLDALVVRSPLQPDAHLLRGEAEWHLGQLPAAIVSFGRALETADLLAGEAAQLGDATGRSTAFRHWPGRSRAQFRRGLARLEAGDAAGACADLEAAAADPVWKAKAFNALGRALLAQGDPARARRWFEEAVAAGPDAPEAYGHLAELLDPTEDAGRRRELWRRSRDLTRAPDAPWAEDLRRGNERLVHFMQHVQHEGDRAENYRLCALAYRRALLEHGRLSSAHVGLALAALCSLDLPRAREHLGRAIVANPEDPQGWLQRAAMGRDYPGLGVPPAEVERDFRRALEADPDHAEACLQLGVFLERGGRADEARTLYDRALQTDSTLGAAWKRRSDLRFRAGDEAGGRDDFRRWRAAPPQTSLSRHYKSVADAYENRRDFAIAEHFYSLSVERDWKNADAYMTRAQIQQRRSQFGRYLLDFGRALEVDPRLETKCYSDVMSARIKLPFLVPMAAKEYAPILQESGHEPAAQFMAGFLSFALGEYDKAVRYFARCLDLNPDFVPAYNVQGYCLCLLGRESEGKQAFALAVERLPGSGLSHYFQACVEAGYGRPVEARAALERAVALGFYSGEVARVQREFKAFLSEPWFQALFRDK